MFLGLQYGVTLGIFIILGIYHFLIYFGRKEKYQLSYAALNFSLVFYLVSFRILPFLYGNTIYVLMCSTASILFFGATTILFLYTIFDLKKIKRNIFYTMSFVFFAAVILANISLITKKIIYLKIFEMLSGVWGLQFFSLLTWHIIKYKQYKSETSRLIFFGFAGIILIVPTTAFIKGVWKQAPFILNYIPFIFLVIIFAYAISRIFTKEHDELIVLKDNLQDEVEKQTKELKKATEQKTDFFINLAHETKTPLTLISNYLNKDINNRGRSKNIQIVEQNINKLKNDMLNFLDIEKLEKGIEFYNHDQVIEINSVIRQKVMLFREMAKKKNIN